MALQYTVRTCIKQEIIRKDRHQKTTEKFFFGRKSSRHISATVSEIVTLGNRGKCKVHKMDKSDIKKFLRFL